MSLVNTLKRKMKFIIKIIEHREIIVRKDVDVTLENVGNGMMDSAFIFLKGLENAERIIIVSAGIGDQINFELDILKKLSDKDVKLFAIDPTPKALQFLESVELPENFHVIPCALCGEDKKIQFALPSAEGWISGSGETLKKDERKLEEVIEVDGKRLSTILKENNIQKVDLLKLDIEGSEFAALDNILSEKVDVKQMTIDLHHRSMVNNKNLLKNLIKKFHKYGYKICFVEKGNLNICCIKNAL